MVSVTLLSIYKRRCEEYKQRTSVSENVIQLVPAIDEIYSNYHCNLPIPLLDLPCMCLIIHLSSVSSTHLLVWSSPKICNSFWPGRLTLWPATSSQASSILCIWIWLSYYCRHHLHFSQLSYFTRHLNSFEIHSSLWNYLAILYPIYIHEYE